MPVMAAAGFLADIHSKTLTWFLLRLELLESSECAEQQPHSLFQNSSRSAACLCDPEPCCFCFSWKLTSRLLLVVTVPVVIQKFGKIYRNSHSFKNDSTSLTINLSVQVAYNSIV